MHNWSKQYVILASIIIGACSGESTPSETPVQDVSAQDINYEFDWNLEDTNETETDDAHDEEVLIDPGPCHDQPDGSDCDDNSLCTVSDTCLDGFCIPGPPLQCGEKESGSCEIAYCDPETGCVNGTASDGSDCPFPCFTKAQCVSGKCLPTAGSDTQCPVPDDPCIEAMACVPETNKCTVALYKLACPQGSICHAEEGPNGPGKLTCVPLFENLCMPCNNHTDCEDPLFENETQLCIPTSNNQGSFCGADCSTHACPVGYKCTTTTTDAGATVEQCIPEERNSCDCQPQWSALLKWTNCESSNSYGQCEGKRICTPQGLSSCNAKTPSPEICDGIDNNCNGTTDEGTETLCGEPGACCMKDGGCQGLFEQSCANQEGVFQGIGVLCAQAACGGNVQGACCLPNQNCALLQYNQCQNAGGSYKGDGMNCGDIDCTIPSPTGACCHVNASCAEFTALSCIQQQGYFQGNGVGCNDITCTSMGACCLPNGQCKLVSKTACTALAGNWNKNFVCSDVACLPGDGMGACCLEGGGCAVLQPEECTNQSGDFLSGENCFGQCGGAELGACCYINGDCAQTASSSCPANATWKGQGSMCGNAACGDSGTGACCAIGACYEGFTAAECALLPGEYQGNDTTCEVCK